MNLHTAPEQAKFSIKNMKPNQDRVHMELKPDYVEPAVASLQHPPTVLLLQQLLVPLDLFDDHAS